jgi:hypothetical protein
MLTLLACIVTVVAICFLWTASDRIKPDPTNYIVTGRSAHNENERHVASVTCLPDTVRP